MNNHPSPRGEGGERRVPGEVFSHYDVPSARTMTMRCTSDVPS